MKNARHALWLLIPIILFATLGAFSRIMSVLSHNEHMYIAAGVLVAKSQVIYRDFAFVQTPYLPLLYGNVYRLTGLSHYYLAGKLISFALLGTSGMFLFLLARRVTKDMVLSLSIAALFLLNMNIVNPAVEVSNYILPLALSLAGLSLNLP